VEKIFGEGFTDGKQRRHLDGMSQTILRATNELFGEKEASKFNQFIQPTYWLN
jgi:hypothetical protein